MDWLDITLHSIPPFLVCGFMGFIGAFGYISPTNFEMTCWIGTSLIGAGASMLIWPRREQRQHGGHLGGVQSKLEGYVPIGIGSISYVASFLAFIHWPI